MIKIISQAEIMCLFAEMKETSTSNLCLSSSRSLSTRT
jgi:hypothetical protein